MFIESEWGVTLVDLMSRWVSTELHRQRTAQRLQREHDRLDRFTSMVPHDIRNPLNVLSGRLQLAEETGDPEEFARCRDAIDRMEALIVDLLDLARGGTVIADTSPGPRRPRDRMLGDRRTPGHRTRRRDHPDRRGRPPMAHAGLEEPPHQRHRPRW